MRRLTQMMLCAIALSLSGFAHADNYPSKPIKIIVAFGPGSGGDILARLLAQYLQPTLQTPVVVENKVGALGQIATLALARAPADGYTVGMGSSSTHSTAPFLTKDLPYDPIKDFSAVGGLNRYTFVLLVPGNSDAKNPQQLVEQLLAKKQAFYGYGNASGRVGAAHFNRLAKLNATEVAYKSSPEALTDLSAGRVDFVFNDWGSSRALVESGRLRAIGVMADERSPVLPELPALGESYPGFNFSNWGGLMAPAGIPDDVVATLNAALLTVLNQPEVVQRMTSLGLEVKPSSAKDLEKLVADEQQAWGAAIQQAGIDPS